MTIAAAPTRATRKRANQTPKTPLAARPPRRTDRERSTPSPRTACPRCHRGDVAISAKHPICRTCANDLATQAHKQQELAYLANWLSSRVTEKGDPLEDSALVVYAPDRLAVRRTVKRARAAGLDWQRPPAPVAYDTRLATLMAPWRAAA